MRTLTLQTTSKLPKKISTFRALSLPVGQTVHLGFSIRLYMEPLTYAASNPPNYMHIAKQTNKKTKILYRTLKTFRELSLPVVKEKKAKHKTGVCLFNITII